MTDFKKGDRVRLTRRRLSDSHEWLSEGNEGIITCVGTTNDNCKVDWDNVGQPRYGLLGPSWWVSLVCIELASPRPILTFQERLSIKMKSLDERFKNKTLPRTTSTPLPLGK